MRYIINHIHILSKKNYQFVINNYKLESVLQEVKEKRACMQLKKSKLNAHKCFDVTHCENMCSCWVKRENLVAPCVPEIREAEKEQHHGTLSFLSYMHVDAIHFHCAFHLLLISLLWCLTLISHYYKIQEVDMDLLEMWWRQQWDE